MKATFQQQLIGDYLHSKYMHYDKWPFLSAAEVVAKLCSMSLRLLKDEYIAAVVDNADTFFLKVVSLEELSAIPSNAEVVSYAELERVLHERYTEWVEV